MATFTELHERLVAARNRKAVLQMLVEHIDNNFIPSGPAKAERVLLNDDRLAVPQEMFEAVIADTLDAEIEQLNQEITRITNTELAQKTATPKAEPEKKTKKSHKNQEAT
jgi:hypothetical protein